MTNNVTGDVGPIKVLTGQLEEGCIHTVPCVVETELSQKKGAPYIGENP